MKAAGTVSRGLTRSRSKWARFLTERRIMPNATLCARAQRVGAGCRRRPGLKAGGLARLLPWCAGRVQRGGAGAGRCQAAAPQGCCRAHVAASSASRGRHCPTHCRQCCTAGLPVRAPGCNASRTAGQPCTPDSELQARPHHEGTRDGDALLLDQVQHQLRQPRKGAVQHLHARTQLRPPIPSPCNLAAAGQALGRLVLRRAWQSSASQASHAAGSELASLSCTCSCRPAAAQSRAGAHHAGDGGVGLAVQQAGDGPHRAPPKADGGLREPTPQEGHLRIQGRSAGQPPDSGGGPSRWQRSGSVPCMALLCRRWTRTGAPECSGCAPRWPGRPSREPPG